MLKAKLWIKGDHRIIFPKHHYIETTDISGYLQQFWSVYFSDCCLHFFIYIFIKSSFLLAHYFRFSICLLRPCHNFFSLFLINQHFSFVLIVDSFLIFVTVQQKSIYILLINVSKSKVGDLSRGWPEGSLFNNYYTEVEERVLLLSLIFSPLPLIRTLYYWVLSKELSSTIFKVFGMTCPGIEPRSPKPLANTLATRPMSRLINNAKVLLV